MCNYQVQFIAHLRILSEAKTVATLNPFAQFQSNENEPQTRSVRWNRKMTHISKVFAWLLSKFMPFFVLFRVTKKKNNRYIQKSNKKLSKFSPYSVNKYLFTKVSWPKWDWLFDDFDQAQGYELYIHITKSKMPRYLARYHSARPIIQIDWKKSVCAFFCTGICTYLALGNIQCILIIICNKYA